jgi:hypothetical protein
MVDNHSYSFFGQKVGLIVQSASKNDPHIFFRLIKSKNNGSWEKPSSGEGKIIKFSLEEIIWILRVLNKEVSSWSSYHNYKDNKTSISLKWEDGEKAKLWIHIGSYSKVLEYSQFTILKKLLDHILQEKIEFATVISSSSNDKKSNSKEPNTIFIQEEVITEKKIDKLGSYDKQNNENHNKVLDVNGFIKGETNKALLIQFNNGSEVWIPKSTIHSNFNIHNNLVQKFTIDSWILRNNKIFS